jgi:RsiW-degrading membrane proteinase PrsW (M82 family)
MPHQSRLEPEPVPIKNAAIIVALSFATFENVCYLIQNGAGHFSFIFFRGIGTGAMHVICGAIVGGGLAYVWQRTWLKIAGTCGLLGAAITFHAIYNLLIAYGGAIQYIAYILPVLILTVGKLIVRLPQSHKCGVMRNGSQKSDEGLRKKNDKKDENSGGSLLFPA